MFTWLRQLRDRLVKRRAERRATAGERAQKRNEAEALKYKQERGHGGGGGMGPLGPGV